ncbi:cell division protein DedD [Variovorax sp. SRS16]|uniref:SPOR domain-containing protein n=1 Tax=Variovorax sp. SRS16 TaxID=282217 RepID=UPI00131637FE|nr:SPOR domain-containing protein [Variovorax sp. SRS16]VTU24839.1 cell division protein DedD [Variovorax sp. SRS16]
MAFFKFRTRGPQGNEGRNTSVASAPAESIEAMRRRARHRLLGAAVLVLVGVIGFPLLFDTQPRPIAVDIPIEIPDRAKVKPLPLPATPAPAPAAASTPAPTPGSDAGKAAEPSTRVAAASRSSSPDMITESADGAEIAPDKPSLPAPDGKSESAPAPETKPHPKPEPKAEAKTKAEAKAESKPEPKPAPAKPSPADDASRARALLEGKSAPTVVAAAKPAAAAEDSGRFVVQVGAFADADKAREVRQKLEKAGLKTFTTVTKTAGGERTRVRVGPFGSRAEADRAAGRVKGLSLPAAVLSL